MSTSSRALIVASVLATATAAYPGAAAAADADAHTPSDAPAKPAPNPLVPYPPPSPRFVPPPDQGFTYARPQPYPSLAWLAIQLVPSPELVVGRVRETNASGDSELSTKTAFGLRWQLTPILWSWGVSRHASRWRFLVVDPLARHSGSLELPLNLEYIFGDVDRMIVRPGIRAYFPLAHRGEYLSTSIGTSTYVFDDKLRVAYDVGAYVLSGIFGIQATFAPDSGPLMAIGTFRIRYF